MATLKYTRVDSIASERAASASDECVRKGEMDAAVALKANIVHAHLYSEVTGFGSGVQAYLAGHVESSDTIEGVVTEDDVTFNVRLKTDGGLESDGDGVGVDFGSGVGGVARASHTHSQLHDPMTVADTASVALALDGQELSASVVLDVNGGLEAGAGGVGLSFGIGVNDAARGNHGHAQLHDPVGVIDTASINLTMTGQTLTAAVRRDTAPTGGVPLGESASGLYVPTVEGGVAAFTHTHDAATADAAGFLSAADKAGLDALDAVWSMEIPVAFHRHDPLQTNARLRGQCRFGVPMQLVRLDVTGMGPSADTTVTLEVDGALTDAAIVLPAGGSSVEVTAHADIANQYIEPDATCRWMATAGPVSGVVTSGVALFMNVRPANLSAVRINCGGTAEDPYTEDAGYTRGLTLSTTSSIDTTGLTDPAPEAVYQCARSSATAFSYVLSGVPRGLGHTVRLHVAELSHESPGQRVFDAVLSGVAVQRISDIDTVQTMGARYRANILEFDDPVYADADGRVTLTLEPKIGSAAINGIELYYDT